MTRLEVDFDNGRGQRLRGTVHRPDPRQDLASGVVVCHGMLSSRGSPKHTGLCDALAGRGYWALRFDFAGRGESEGTGEDLRYDGQVEDLVAAWGQLAAWATPLVAVGSSMGGAVAILAARRLPGLLGVVGISAVGDPWQVLAGIVGGDAAFERWEREGVADVAGHSLPWGLAVSSRRADALGAAAALDVPLRLIHGENDEVVPLSQAHALAASSGGGLCVVAGGDHLLHRESDQALLEREVCDFVDSCREGRASP